MRKTIATLVVAVVPLLASLCVAAPAHATPATESAAMKDARELATGLEVYFVTEGHWPRHLDAKTLKAMDVNLAKGNVVRRYKAGVRMQHAGGDIYRFCIVNDRVGGWSNYESYDGGITAHAPRGRDCRFPK